MLTVACPAYPRLGPRWGARRPAWGAHEPVAHEPAAPRALAQIEDDGAPIRDEGVPAEVAPLLGRRQLQRHLVIYRPALPQARHHERALGVDVRRDLMRR